MMKGYYFYFPLWQMGEVAGWLLRISGINVGSCGNSLPLVYLFSGIRGRLGDLHHTP